MHPALSIGMYVAGVTITYILCHVSIKPGYIISPALKGLYFVVTVLCLLVATTPIFGAMLPDGEFKFFLQKAGNIWLGFFVYFPLLVLILSIVQGIIRLFHGPMIRGLVPGISFVVSLTLLIYGMIHAQQTVVTYFDVDIAAKDAPEEDLKVILLGDLHLSVNSVLSTTEKMVELVNAEDADVVLIAGDIFNSSYNGMSQPEKYAEALRGMKAKYGVYAVYGNHDVKETLFGGFPISPISQAFRTKEMEDFMADCNFKVLYDETAEIADGKVQIVGRIDGEKAGDGTSNRMSPAEVLSGIDPDKPVIVLQHEPVEFAALYENGADLAVCGHTHAGQIFPGNLIVPFFNKNAYGYKNVGGLDTVVTSGVGYYGPPMRIGTNSEVAVLTVHFK